MNKPTKVIGIGDTIYFLADNYNTIEYEVKDIAIYLFESGNWDIGFALIFDKNFPAYTIHPYWIIKDLMDHGMMWKKGGEEMAKFLREKDLTTTKNVV